MPELQKLWKLNMSWEEYESYISETEKKGDLILPESIDFVIRSSLTQHMILLALALMMTFVYPVDMSFAALGLCVWPIVEYYVHRFAFHELPHKLKFGRQLQLIHYLVHGYHHKYPHDNTLLLWPAPVVTAIMFTLYRILNYFCVYESFSVVFGFFVGYWTYDFVHYMCHDTSEFWSFFRKRVIASQVTAHRKHHFVTHSAPYGVLHTWMDK